MLLQELCLVAIGVFSTVINGIRRKIIADRMTGRRVHRNAVLRPGFPVLEPLGQREESAFSFLWREDRSRRRFPQYTPERPYFARDALQDILDCRQLGRAQSCPHDSS